MAKYSQPDSIVATLTHLSFRKMVLDDISDVCAIEQSAHYHPWTKQQLIDAIPSYHCWLLIQNQQIIGYGMLKTVADEAELLNIVVAPKYQGKGLGKKLLTQLMLEAEKLGASECFLEVRESNRFAYQLYEQFGFNEVGRRPNYYPAPQGYEDALLMVYSIGKF